MAMISDLTTYREQGLMPGVFHWLEQELHCSADEVTSLSLDADVRETTFDRLIYGPLSPWRTFAPTGLYHIGLTFFDEQIVQKTFTSQEMGTLRGKE